MNEIAEVIGGLTERTRPYGGPRAALGQDAAALAEALDTLRIQHEGLLVADEELRAQLEEMRQMEAAAIFANERAEAFFVGAPEPQLITDRHGVVREANRAAVDLLGLRGRFLVGKPLATVIDRADTAIFHAVTSDVAQGNVVEAKLRLRTQRAAESTTTLALVHPFSEGRRFFWRLRIVRDERAEAPQPTSDLGQERAALRDQESANHAKDRMIALVSHDLRGPLNAITGWVDILRKSPDDTALREKALTTIDRAARQQARLVDDLLDISRLAAGKLRVVEERVDLAGLVRSEVDGVRPVADARGVRLHVADDPEMKLPIAGDASRLRQVLANLLGNAIKFTPRRGAIYVEVAEENGHAVVTVRDTGKGILPSALETIFEAFRQEAGGEAAHDGLGLGLFISRQIVEIHRGTLTCASDGDGKGATFTLTLPLQVEPAQAALASAPRISATEKSRPLDGVRVLVVEDDPDSRELAGIIIRTSGGSPTLASSVAAAIETLDVFEPDVVVSDIRMPGEDDGNHFVQALRKSRHSDVPAIAVSGNASPGELQRALHAGFDAYLVKPVTMEVLVKAISDAAEMGRAVRTSSPPPARS